MSYRGKVIDDVVITAEFKFIDGENGVLGQADPSALRTGTFIPCAANMEFDTGDLSKFFLNSDGSVSQSGFDIILHEMLHSIGFGTNWSRKSLVIEDGFGGYRYTGEQGNLVYPGEALIPVEGDYGSGTRLSHRDEQALTIKLMTGTIDPANCLANWTWASFHDLGYPDVIA